MIILTFMPASSFCSHFGLICPFCWPFWASSTHLYPTSNEIFSTTMHLCQMCTEIFSAILHLCNSSQIAWVRQRDWVQFHAGDPISNISCKTVGDYWLKLQEKDKTKTPLIFPVQNTNIVEPSSMISQLQSSDLCGAVVSILSQYDRGLIFYVYILFQVSAAKLSVITD